MKTLLLCRHAKSSWDNEELADYERPLSPRGEQAAPRIGEYLRQVDLIPDLVLSSTARRAWDTIEAAARTGGFLDRVQPQPDLYDADLRTYRAILREVPDHVTRVMLVGHNPALEEFLEQLTGREEHLPTASIAHIELDLEHWRELDARTRGRLISFWRVPKKS